MLAKEYLKRLNQYVGKDIDILENSNELTIYYDVETKYILKKNQTNYKLFVEIRNARQEMETFSTELEMKRKFALWMKGIFGPSIEYPRTEEVEAASDMISLSNMINKYIESDFFSINCLQKNKINLEKRAGDCYDIFFLNENGEKKIIEENQPAPYIFGRFYNEIVFFQESINRINEYEIIFEDKLSYIEKIQLLSY